MYSDFYYAMFTYPTFFDFNKKIYKEIIINSLVYINT